MERTNRRTMTQLYDPDTNPITGTTHKKRQLTDEQKEHKYRYNRKYAEKRVSEHSGKKCDIKAGKRR